MSRCCGCGAKLIAGVSPASTWGKLVGNGPESCRYMEGAETSWWRVCRAVYEKAYMRIYLNRCGCGNERTDGCVGGWMEWVGMGWMDGCMDG